MRRVWHEDGAMAGVQTAGPFACRVQSERMRSALLRSPDRARLANGAGQFGVRRLPWERPAATAALPFIPLRGGLVECHGPVEHPMVRGVERLHVEGVCGRGCQSELFETFDGREYRENVVFEIAEVLIGGDESARLVIVREDVAAVKRESYPSPSSEKSVGIRSICETVRSTTAGATNSGAKMKAGMWYLSSGISVFPALEAQWSAVTRKTVLANHGCRAASRKSSPRA